MGKKRKNLTPEEVDRIRAGIAEVQRDVKQLIAFLQTKLDAAKG